VLEAKVVVNFETRCMFDRELSTKGSVLPKESKTQNDMTLSVY